MQVLVPLADDDRLQRGIGDEARRAPDLSVGHRVHVAGEPIQPFQATRLACRVGRQKPGFRMRPGEIDQDGGGFGQARPRRRRSARERGRGRGRGLSDRRPGIPGVGSCPRPSRQAQVRKVPRSPPARCAARTSRHRANSTDGTSGVSCRSCGLEAWIEASFRPDNGLDRMPRSPGP